MLVRFGEHGLSWPLPADLGDTELEQMLYPREGELALCVIPRIPFRRISSSASSPPTHPTTSWSPTSPQHPTGEGWLYTAAVVGVFCRKVIGWATSENLQMQFVRDALNMAVRSRHPIPGSTIHHSDHGAQYTAMAYGQRLKATGLAGSMGSVGDAYDNALMESFARPPDLAHEEFPALGDLRVHRGILQPPPGSLSPRLPVPKLDPNVWINRPDDPP